MEKKYEYGVIHEYNGINGGLYDAIEYAYMLSTIGETKLTIKKNRYKSYLWNYSEENIKNIINYKYTFNYNNICINYENTDIKLDKNIYKSVLFLDSQIIRLLPLYKANKYCIIADYVKNSIDKYFNKIKNLKNIYVFNEFPYFPSPVNYKCKFLFNKFKIFDKLEHNTLISKKYGNWKHETTINNKVLKWPIENFNKLFDRYETYSYDNWFEPRGRLYVECLFYGISIDNIIRHIEKENYDGGYYRLKDLKENGLENRYLTINDEVIQCMINT